MMNVGNELAALKADVAAAKAEIAELKRWREVMVVADLADVARTDPPKAATIRAMGLRRADFEALYVYGIMRGPGPSVTCLSCGQTRDAEAVRGGQVIPHLPACALAPAPTPRKTA
jgi:hypothetical protein